MNSLSISVGALRHALAMRPTEARVNITIVPQGDTAQDFDIHSMHWDDAVDTFDLVVNLPEGVSLVHSAPSPDMHAAVQLVALAIRDAYRMTSEDSAMHIHEVIDTVRQNIGNALAGANWCSYDAFSDMARLIDPSLPQAPPAVSTPTPDYVRYATIFAADVSIDAQLDSELNTEEFCQLSIDIGKIAAKRNDAARAAGEDFYPVAFVEQAAQRLNQKPDATLDELLAAGQRECDSLAGKERKVWSSGWNIPGYLPEVDPMNFDTWVDARDALSGALHQAADDTSIPHAEHQAYLDAIDRLSRAEDGIDWCERVGNYVWWVQQIVLPRER